MPGGGEDATRRLAVTGEAVHLRAQDAVQWEPTGRVGAMAERRRVRAARLRRRVRVALRLTLATAALLALLDFLRSDVFVVDKVTISGLVRLRAEEVQSQAELSRRQLIWEVWPWRAERLLRRHPRVMEADVRVRLPNRVLIRVVERDPVAFVLTGTGDYAEVDREGRVLAVWASLPRDPLPVITGVAAKEVQPGQRLGDPSLQDAVAVAAGLGPSLRAAVSEVHVNSARELVLYTMDPIPVYLGAGEEIPAKLRALSGIYGSLAAPGEVAYIDLRSARRPAVRMKGPVPAPPPEPEVPDRLAIP